MRKIKQHSGLTLIELLVTLTVLGIMVVIGVPQYQRMTATNRSAGSINSLASDLKLARTEAAKRSQVVTLCPSIDGGLTCSNTPNWENGWIVFSDVNRDGVFDNPPDVRVSLNTGLPVGLTLTATRFPDPAVIQYAPSGRLRTVVPDPSPDGTFLLCQTGVADVNVRNTQARGINVTNTGRVSASLDADANDIREDITGANFACPL